MPPGSMVYPLRQRWFATRTQMANEPTYVDAGESFRERRIYYHAGLDIGGAEGQVDVVAAMGGVVVSAGKATLDEYRANAPVEPRYDRVYVLDDRGWIELYCHLQSIDQGVRPGSRLRIGQKIGVLGKEGDSGGWSHLHFEILCRQASGRWGTLEGYALLWEAYQSQYGPDLIAVARPHQAVVVGEKVVLDASRSWSRNSQIVRYEWTSGDGVTVLGERVERTFPRPGTYSEILKVTDANGHADWDFATVNVLDPAHQDEPPPSIHATYWPTTGILPGQTVRFEVRTFGTTDGEEVWDFGDGGAKVTTRSDGNVVALAKDGYAATMHAFRKPGDYIVRVERARAIAHLHVKVEGVPPSDAAK
jgi:murein DD-endopeptidase MepM/ murein hydrolase activator NlpD